MNRDLRIAKEEIEALAKQVKRAGHVDQVPSVAALAARCAIEMAGRLGNVWAGLHDVKSTLSEASNAADRQTAALVKWTKTLVYVTGAYALITGGLLLVAILSAIRQ